MNDKLKRKGRKTKTDRKTFVEQKAHRDEISTKYSEFTEEIYHILTTFPNPGAQTQGTEHAVPVSSTDLQLSLNWALEKW